MNQPFVRRFRLPDNPVGEVLRRKPSGEDDNLQIVGLAEDTLYRGLRENWPPIVFVPVVQNRDPRGYTDFTIRCDVSLASVSSAVRSSVARLGPRLAIQVTRFSATIQGPLPPERLMATLSGYFGVLAALIAAVGLCGVMSYIVAGRTREIGVRIAMGGAAIFCE